MSDDLSSQLQGMFRSIYEALDIKYMRPIKVCYREHNRLLICLILYRMTMPSELASSLIPDNPFATSASYVQMWHRLFRRQEWRQAGRKMHRCLRTTYA